MLAPTLPHIASFSIFCGKCIEPFMYMRYIALRFHFYYLQRNYRNKFSKYNLHQRNEYMYVKILKRFLKGLKDTHFNIYVKFIFHMFSSNL